MPVYTVLTGGGASSLHLAFGLRAGSVSVYSLGVNAFYLYAGGVYTVKDSVSHSLEDLSLTTGLTNVNSAVGPITGSTAYMGGKGFDHYHFETTGIKRKYCTTAVPPDDISYAEVEFHCATTGWYGIVLKSSNCVAGDCAGSTLDVSIDYLAGTDPRYDALIDPDPTPGDDDYTIIPPGDTIELVGVLTEAFNRVIRPVRNEPGSGTFTVNRYSENASATTLRAGNLVKARYLEIDPDPIFAWFMESFEDSLVSSNEEGGENIVVAGRGALSYWERAIWLSQMFAVQWWDSAWGTPPAGAIGHIDVVAGTYHHYTISGGVITGYTTDTVAAFGAYYDTAREYDWPSAGARRFAVHVMAGETHAGWYIHTHQDGVTVVKPSYAIGSTILLSSISPDTPGAILYRMFLEATNASRPDQPIPLMTVDFTATLDSNGDAWATTDALTGVTVQLGETYLETIAKLVATGVIDVEMGPDLDMHAYNSQGRDLSSSSFAAGKVRFVKGVNIADELKRERSDVPVGTFIEVAGLDDTVGQASLPDAATRVAREVSATGDSNDTTVLAAMGLADLNARLIRSDAIGFRMATGDDDAAGFYLPGPAGTDHGDFWLGDVVTVHTGTGDQDFNEEDERVYAITIAEDEAGNLDVTPEVGSVLGDAERRLYDRGQSSSGGASFVTRSQFTDTAVAETPIVAHADLTGLASDDHTAYTTVINGGGDTVSAHGNTGSTETFDPGAGNVHTATLDANCTFTLTAPASGTSCVIELYLTQDGTGSRTVTWPGSVVWVGGSAPTLSTAAAAVDRIILETLNGGTTWFGVMVGSGSGGSGVTYGTPAIVLGTAAAAGAIDEAIRRDSTIVAFDATVPVTQASGDAAATGTAVVAARRDHKHGMPSILSDPMTTRGDFIVRNASNVTARLAVGAANRLVRSDGTDPSWGQVVEADLNLIDVSTANATTGQHGFLPKLTGSTTTFLRGDGSYSTPAGSGGGAAIDDEASVVALELFL